MNEREKITQKVFKYTEDKTTEKEFLSLCKEFIDAERIIEKDDNYALKDDFSVLYRFINRFGWSTLRDWGNRGLI